jgi:hypothetical protein
MCHATNTAGNKVANIWAMHRATDAQRAELNAVIDELIADSYGQNGSTWVKDADGLGVTETTVCGTVIGWWAAKCECGRIDVHQEEFSEDMTCASCDGVLTVQDRRMNRLSGFKAGHTWKY